MRRMPEISEMIAARAKFEERVDAALRQAEVVMAIADIDGNDEEAIFDLYEERFHCEKCIVRTIMEIVWDPIEQYVTSLEQALGYDASYPHSPVEKQNTVVESILRLVENPDTER